ncbi:MAG: hypothetical protein ACLQF4_04190, partial [Xanthobacteraceae bacterium]
HVHRAATGQVGRIPASVAPCIATTLRKGEYPPPMKTRPLSRAPLRSGLGLYHREPHRKNRFVSGL